LNITVTRFTHEGMLVKSMLVPLVDATDVPETIFAVEDHVVPLVLKGMFPVAVGAAATTATPPTVVAPVSVEVPVTVRFAPAVTLPLESLTRFVVALDG
jgi:hypothetical protein